MLMDRKEQLRKARRASRVPLYFAAEILTPIILLLIFRERLIEWPYAGPALGAWTLVMLITAFIGLRWRQE